MIRVFDHIRGGVVALILVFAVAVAIAGKLNPQAFDAGSFSDGIRIGSLLLLVPATNAELNSTVTCPDYPTVRCLVYNLDEDDVMTAISTTDWRSLQNGLAP